MDRIIKLKSQAKRLAKNQNIKMKVALDIIAAKNNHSNWKSFKNAVDIFWYQKSSPFFNHWFALHQDAMDHMMENGGYLLPYKGQYFVVEKEYIEYIGLDPDHSIWEVIGYDASTSTAVKKLITVFKV